MKTYEQNTKNRLYYVRFLNINTKKLLQVCVQFCPVKLISAVHFAGIMQQFAISEATLSAWNSMCGESFCADSNQGSVAHLSEVNQESITSRGEDYKHDIYITLIHQTRGNMLISGP